MAGLLGLPARRDPRWPRDFHHRRRARLLTPREVWRLRRSFPPPAARVGNGIGWQPADPPPPAPGRIAITWLGHASTLLSVDGATLLIDPVLAGGIAGARTRLTPPPLPTDRLPPIDAVLITHDHYDHLDARTLRRLPRRTPVVAGAGSAPWFARRGFTDVTELDWWESRPVGDVGAEVDVEFVPAQHWSRRGPFDTCRRLWGGYVVTGRDGRAVLHAGDTGHGPHLARIGERHRSLALAALPVGAYAPRDLLRAVHMDPYDAVRAADDLGVRRVVPVHWGTFVLSGEAVTAPRDGVRAAWAAAGRDPADLWELPVGGSRVL